MKTFMPKAADITRQWYVVDAEGQVFGRVASQVANILRGKNKPIYTPNVDTGDYVIIINADKIVMTGKKLDQKIYYHHTGYVGGLKETKYRKLRSLNLQSAVLSWVCCPRDRWVARWPRSSRSTLARIMTMRRRSP